MVGSIVAVIAGILLFGAGGWWLFEGKGLLPAAGLAAQAVGMAIGLAGLVTLVLPGFFG